MAPLFTRNFWLMCLATVCFFVSNHLLTPSLPLFLSQPQRHLAGEVGLLLAAFMVSSVILRPFVGKWCDETDPRRWMVLGALLFGTMPLLYTVSVDTPFFLPVRIFHGAGLACFMTAANAFLSTEIPTSRRAEGMSHYGNAIKLAMAIGPAIGLVLAHRNQYQELFWVAGGTALLTLAMVLFLTPQATQVAVSTPKRTGKLFNKHAAFPGLVMTANSVVFGTLIPFTPMLSVEKGFGPEISWFYGIYAFSLIFSRALTGPLSDRYGRDRVIVPGMIGVVISVLLLAMAMHPVFFLLSAACYGVCAGTVQPSLMAMVADRVPANERGSGMATFTLFTDLGVAGGTYLTGSLGPLVGYGNVLYGIAGITLIGLVGFLAGQRLQKPPVKKEEAYA